MELYGCAPMWFDSFYVSLLSSKYKHNGRANWLAALWIGFVSNLKALGIPGNAVR